MVQLTVFAFKLVQKDTHCTRLAAVVFTIFDIAGAITYTSKESVDYLAAGTVQKTLDRKIMPVIRSDHRTGFMAGPRRGFKGTKKPSFLGRP
jgi:hypothetical protein